MATKERIRAEPRFVEIQNVDEVMERTTAKFQDLMDNFKKDTQIVLDDFNRLIREQKTAPIPMSESEKEKFKRFSVARDSTRTEDLEALFKKNTSSPTASPTASRSVTPERNDSEERAPLGLETSNPSESDEERDERLAQSLAKLRVSDSEGGNGSNSHTKKRKNNFKKPWPTRSSRKPNGKGRKTRSRPRN